MAITAEEFVKAYYQAHRDGLNAPQLAKILGRPTHYVYMMANRLQTQLGQKLPKLARAPKGNPNFIAANKKPKKLPPHSVYHPAEKRPAKKGLPHFVPATDFVRAYQTADDLQQVCDKLGMTKWAVWARASYLRKELGVPLKTFKKLDARAQAAELIALAKSLMPTESYPLSPLLPPAPTAHSEQPVTP